MTTTQVGIKLTLDGAQQAEAGLRRVAGTVDQMGASVRTLGSALPQLASAFAGLVSVREFIQAADAVAGLQNNLKLATGSAQSASQAYEQLFAIAQRSRTNFVELGNTFASISRASESLGLTQAQILTLTETIGNAITVSGAGAAASQAALTQLSQGLASGVLRGDELNSILEQTPRLARALADGLGVSVGALREMGAAGQLSAEKVVRALQSQSAVLAGEVATSVVTVGQAFTQLENATTKTVGEFDKASGASKSLAVAVQSLAGGVQTLGQFFRENEASIQVTLGVLAGAATAAGIARVGVALAGVTAGVGGVAGAVTALKLVVAGLNPATLILLGLGAVAGGATAYDSYYRGTAEGIKETIAQLEQANKLAANNLERMQGRPEVIEQINKAIAERSKRIGDLTEKLRGLNAESARANAPDGSVAGGDVALTRALNADRARRQKSYDAMMGDLATPQEKLNKAIADAKESLGDLYSPALEARIREKYIKPTNDAAEAAKRLAAEERKRDLDVGTERNRAAGQAYKERVAAEEAAIAQQVKAYEELVKAEDRVLLSRVKSAESAEEQVARLQLEEDAVFLAATANISLAEAVERLALARLQEARDKALAEGADGATLLALQREIAAREKLVGLVAGKEARTVADDSAKRAAQEWERTSQEIERTLTDALMRGFESGKGFAEVLRDTVVNMFKTLVLRPVIQATVQGGLNAVGLGGPAGSAGGSGLGNLNNFVGAGLQAYGGYTAGASAASLGYANTVGMFGGDALGALITGNGGWAGVSAGAGAAGGVGAMSSIAAAAPWLLGGLALVSLLSGMDDSGTLHTGGIGSYGTATGLQYGQRSSDLAGYMGTAFDPAAYGEATANGAAQLAKGVAGILDQTAKAFGQQAGFWVASGFADDTSKDGAWGALSITRDGQSLLDWGMGSDRWPGREFADGEKGSAEYLSAVAKDVRDLLVESTPDWADAMLEGLGDSVTMEQLTATVAQINRTQAALVGLGAAMPQLAGLTDEATTALLGMLGGIDGLSAAAGAYYENFYSQSERNAVAVKQLTGSFDDLGLALPSTRQGFRDLVEAQDLTTESGRQTYAQLLRLAPAFDSVADAAAAAAASMTAAWAGVLQARGAGSADVTRFTAQAAIDQAFAQYKQTDRFNIRNAEQFRTITYADFQNYSTEQQALISTILTNLAKRDAAMAPSSAGSSPAAQAVSQDWSRELQALTDGAYEALVRAVRAVQTATDDAFASLQRAVEAERDAARAAEDAAALRISAINSVFDTIKDAVADLYGEVRSTAMLSALDGRALVGGAISSGQLPEAKALSDAISAVRRGFDGTTYTSQFEAERDRLRFAAELSLLGEAATGQLTTAEQALEVARAQLQGLDAQLAAAQAQIDALRGIDTSVLSVGQAIAALQVAVEAETFAGAGQTLEQQLAAAQASIDVLRGIDTSVNSVSDAIATLTAAVAAEASGATASGVGSASGSVSSSGSTTSSGGSGGFVIGGGGGGAPLGTIEEQIAALQAAGKPYHVTNLPGVGIVVSAASSFENQKRIPGYATGGDHLGGLRIVGERGPELEATGAARIFNFEQTRRLLQGGGDNAALLDELRALRADNRAQAAALVRLQGEMTKMMKRWDGNGMPETRVTA